MTDLELLRELHRHHSAIAAALQRYLTERTEAQTLAHRAAEEAKRREAQKAGPQEVKQTSQ